MNPSTDSILQPSGFLAQPLSKKFSATTEAHRPALLPLPTELCSVVWLSFIGHAVRICDEDLFPWTPVGESSSNYRSLGNGMFCTIFLCRSVT